jgi:signal transduction histidine kinase
MNQTFRYIFLPLALAIVFVLSILVLMKAISSYEDKLAKINTTQTVHGVLEIYQDNMVSWAFDSSNWNLSIEKVFIENDRAWIKDNFGQYAIDAFNLSASLIIDDSGNTIFSWSADTETTDTVQLFTPPLERFTADVRLNDDGTPEPVAGFALLNDAPHIVVVSQFVPELNAKLEKAEYGYFIITRELDEQLLTGIETNFAVPGLRFDVGGSGQAPLTDYAGENLGSFSWKKVSSGSLVVKALALWTITGVVVILIILLFQLFRVLRRYQHLSSSLKQRVRDRTESLRAKKLEAERANNAKSEFMSRVSHEFRTPLNAILGFGKLLQMDEKNCSENHAEGLVHIVDAGEHMLSLVDEVLNLAEIDSGKMTFSMESVSVDEALDKSLLLVNGLANKHQVSLDHGSACDTQVHADPKRLVQILVNLLSNAIKYNRDNGTVTVDIASMPDREVRISIRDTGIGISAEDKLKIFEPFNHVGDRFTGVEGIGISLAICRRLIELMGGRIGFDSESGIGSTFWIELARA